MNEYLTPIIFINCIYCIWYYLITEICNNSFLFLWRLIFAIYICHSFEGCIFPSNCYVSYKRWYFTRTWKHIALLFLAMIRFYDTYFLRLFSASFVCVCLCIFIHCSSFSFRLQYDNCQCVRFILITCCIIWGLIVRSKIMFTFFLKALIVCTLQLLRKYWLTDETWL